MNAAAPSSGFKNIKPLTRKERRALKDKIALEKQRLMNRTGLGEALGSGLGSGLGSKEESESASGEGGKGNGECDGAGGR